MKKPRGELTWLGLLIGIAFILRAWAPSHMAVEHFDEGVYASNYFCSHLDYEYPDRHLYAPPLFPAVLEWMLILSGGNPQSVMWVNVVLGTVLVAAIWWLTRMIAGPRAAIAAGILATFSDFLIQYSRVAMTDTPVCLFIVLAVGCSLLSVRQRNILATAGVVLFTSAAWWSKYNGWLPLAILGAGLGGWCVFDRPRFKDVMPKFVVWFSVTLGSFLLWSPYLLSLNDIGGYAGVAKNHAGYIVGWTGWWDSLTRHLTVQASLFELSKIGFIIAYCISLRPVVHCREVWLWLVMILAITIVVAGGGMLIIGGITLFGCLVLFFDPRLLTDATAYVRASGGRPSLVARTDQLPPSDLTQHDVARWIVFAWFLGLFVSTPLYRPYPRLLLPLWISVIILTACGMNFLPKPFMISKTSVRKSQRWFPILFGVVCVASVTMSGIKSSAYENRNSLRVIAGAIADQLRPIVPQVEERYDAIVYVLGEPGLYYHLASKSDLPGADLDFVVQPAQGLVMLQPPPGGATIPTFLVVGPHAPEEMAELRTHPDRARQIAEFPYRRSNFVLLDDFPPSELESNREALIELWQVNSL